MGYGRRALSLLKLYYEGNIPCLDDVKSGPGESIESVDDSELGLLEERIGVINMFFFSRSAKFALTKLFLQSHVKIYRLYY